MEAIKQAADSAADLALFTIILLGVAILSLIIGLLLFPPAKIVTAGEVFEMVGSSSKYSCVISEISNELSLNCLETK
jgi:hypothetical protein